MRINAYKTYAGEEILAADPIKLVQLLYQGATEAVSGARAKLARGDIRGRSGDVSKAIEILSELSSSLNQEKGYDLSARLAELYDYMQRRLIEGHQQQADSPFAEVERLLLTLGEAWSGIEDSAAMKAARGEVAGQSFPTAATPEYVPLSCAY
jgi:flagellar secretion chaperone FliS